MPKISKCLNNFFSDDKKFPQLACCLKEEIFCFSLLESEYKPTSEKPYSVIQVSKKQNVSFLLTLREKIVGGLCDRELASLASDSQGLNFESWVWRAMSSHSSHHPQEVLLAQFSLYVHKGDLKPHSIIHPTCMVPCPEMPRSSGEKTGTSHQTDLNLPNIHQPHHHCLQRHQTMIHYHHSFIMYVFATKLNH